MPCMNRGASSSAFAPVLLSALVVALLGACDGGGGSTDAGSSDAGSSDAGSDSDAGPVEAPSGLPEGESRWSGSFVVAGVSFPVELTLTNAGGDLSGSAAIMDNPDTPLGIGSGEYTVTGTYEPSSHMLALAPNEWTRRPDMDIELLGLLGLYDPASGTIVGTVADYATGEDNLLRGGPGQLSFVSGDGAPTAAGSRDNALPDGSRTFTGTHQCAGSEREVEGTLVYDGGGGLTGSLTFGDPALVDGRNSLEITGVHNPTTGGVTLVPGLYTEFATSYLTFFVEGTYDPGADAIDGHGRTNVGPCPTNLTHLRF